MLLGRKLDGGWSVVEHVARLPSQTGACFSEGYVVERASDGVRAFLKALDYSGAMGAPDPARSLEALTTAYNFERDLLERCAGMDRVVRALASGTVLVQHAGTSQPVQYLLFEFAEQGDVRKYLDLLQQFDTAWALRSIHNVATGLRQLHSAEIAHQDLKPSNVLVFDPSTSKIADLGRASWRNGSATHDAYTIPGDPTYAPVELLYHHVLPDWNQRRLGCDAYHLGSMVVFLFSRANLTALTLLALDPSLRPDSWSGAYADVLPYVRQAFENALGTFGGSFIEGSKHLAGDLVPIVRQLCDPDPLLRGDPRERRPGPNQFSLERYVSRFDLLARREELGLVRA